MAKFYGPVRRNVHVVLTLLAKQWEPALVEKTQPAPKVFNQKHPPKFGTMAEHMRKRLAAVA